MRNYKSIKLLVKTAVLTALFAIPSVAENWYGSWDCSALNRDQYYKTSATDYDKFLSDYTYDDNTGDLCFTDRGYPEEYGKRSFTWSVYAAGFDHYLVYKKVARCYGILGDGMYMPYAYDYGNEDGAIEVEDFVQDIETSGSSPESGRRICLPDADYHLYNAYKKGYSGSVFAPKLMTYEKDGETVDYYKDYEMALYYPDLGRDLIHHPKRPAVMNYSPRYVNKPAVGRVYASYFYNSEGSQKHVVETYKYSPKARPTQHFNYVNGLDSIQVALSLLSKADFQVRFQYRLDSAEWKTFYESDSLKATGNTPVNVVAPQIGTRYFNAKKVEIRGWVITEYGASVMQMITLDIIGPDVDIANVGLGYKSSSKENSSKTLLLNEDSTVYYSAKIYSPYDIEYALRACIFRGGDNPYIKWYPGENNVFLKKDLLKNGYEISIPVNMKDFAKGDNVEFQLFTSVRSDDDAVNHFESNKITAGVANTIKFQVSGEGSVLVGNSSSYVDSKLEPVEIQNGNAIYLRAEPAAGNKFVCWVINDGKCSTTDDVVKQIYVDSAMTVQARFASVESSYNFALSVVGETQYENGAMVKKTYSAGKGPVVVPYTSLYKKSSVISLEMEGSVSLEFLKNKSGSGYSTSRSAFLHYRTNTDPEWRAYSFTSRIIFKQDSLTGRSKTVEFKLPTCAEEDSEGRIDILCSDLKAATEMELKVLGVLANEDTVGYSNSIYLEIQNLNFAWLFRVVADNGYAFYDQNIVNGNVFHLEYEDSHGNTGVINNWNDSAYFPAGEMVKFTPVIGYEYDFKDWFISVGAVPDDPDLDKPYSSDSSITLKMDNNLAISTFIKKRQDIPVSITSVNDLNAGLKDLKFDVSSAHGFRFDTDTLFYLHKGSSLYAVNALDSALIPGDYTVTFNLVFSGSERDYKFLCNKTMPHSVDGKLDYFAPVAVQFLGDTLVAPKLENCAETAGMLKFKFSKNFTVKDTSYIVKFYDVENKQIGKDLKIAFSQTPSAPNVTISKKNNEKMSYKYHWLPEIESAARNVEYHAVLDSFATPYVIKAAAGDTNGNVYGAGTYAYGDSVALAAVAKTGYKFKSWSDDPNAKEVRFLAVNGDTSVVAYFVKVDASSSSSATSSSSGTMSSSSSEEKNAVGTFAKIPDFHLVAFNKSIIVYSAAMGANVIVLDMQGRIIATTQIHAPSVIIDVPQSGAYLVSINRKTQKVLVK